MRMYLGETENQFGFCIFCRLPRVNGTACSDDGRADLRQTDSKWSKSVSMHFYWQRASCSSDVQYTQRVCGM